MQSTPRLYREVADKIALSIRQGKLKTGDRLPSERELASTLGVSRPTIREAIIALEITGQIEVRVGAGIFILDGSKVLAAEQQVDIGPGPFELIEARMHFEAEAAAIAAQRISEQELSALEDACLTMRQAAEAGENAEQADALFHQIIATATRNSAIISAIEQLWAFRTRMPMWRQLHKFISDLEDEPDWSYDKKTLMDHQRILNALRARDADAARQAMRTHLQHVRSALLKASEHEAFTSTALAEKLS